MSARGVGNFQKFFIQNFILFRFLVRYSKLSCICVRCCYVIVHRILICDYRSCTIIIVRLLTLARDEVGDCQSLSLTLSSTHTHTRAINLPQRAGHTMVPPHPAREHPNRQRACTRETIAILLYDHRHGAALSELYVHYNHEGIIRRPISM